MTITSLEPLELPMPEPEDEVDFDPYPEYSSRDEFERAQWFGGQRRPEPTFFDKTRQDPYARATTKSLSEDNAS